MSQAISQMVNFLLSNPNSFIPKSRNSKYCPKCQTRKFLEEFVRYSDGRISSNCKLCRNAISRQWYQKKKAKASRKEKRAE